MKGEVRVGVKGRAKEVGQGVLDNRRMVSNDKEGDDLSQH